MALVAHIPICFTVVSIRAVLHTSSKHFFESTFTWCTNTSVVIAGCTIRRTFWGVKLTYFCRSCWLCQATFQRDRRQCRCCCFQQRVVISSCHWHMWYNLYLKYQHRYYRSNYTLFMRLSHTLTIISTSGCGEFSYWTVTHTCSILRLKT